jgi:hypothetical protein
MRVTTQVVRIYGTRNQYGDAPRTTPPGSPVIFDDFPSAGESVTLHFGAVPADTVEANRVRMAIASVALNSLFGGGPTGGDAVTARLSEMGDDDLMGDYDWYVTLALARHVEVPDQSIADVEFLWMRDAHRLAEPLQEYARPTLDQLATLAASIVDGSVFEHLVLDDRILLSAEGKRASGVPVFTAGGIDAHVRRGEESLRQLDKRLEVLRGVDVASAAQAGWLTRVAHWRMLALTETDPWKRFLWGIFCLEILTHKLYEAHRPALQQSERGFRRVRKLVARWLFWLRTEPLPPVTLRARFSVVAGALFPEDSADDVRDFSRVKKARDRLSHGNLRDEAELPQGDLSRLLQKYFEGAVKRHLLGVPASSPWPGLTNGTASYEKPSKSSKDR